MSAPRAAKRRKLENGGSVIESSDKGISRPTPAARETPSSRWGRGQEDNVSVQDMLGGNLPPIPAINGDAIMEDAGPTPSAEGGEDESGPRTSGRKRQVSRKLEESLRSVQPSRQSSPAASKANGMSKETAKETPPKEAEVTKHTPSRTASARRRRVSSAAGRAPLKNEIEDSEPEDVSRTRSTRATLTGKSPATKASPVNAAATPTTASKQAQPRKRGSAKALRKGTENDEAQLPEPIALPSTADPVIPDHRPKSPAKARPRGQDATVVLEDNANTEIGVKELAMLQMDALAQLTRRVSSKLVGLESEIKKISDLIGQTVTAGESNSMVIIGSRGSGKSVAVDNIIAEQRAEYDDDFHVIRLNGFIHTDDKIAIREIWRQLGREMDVEDDGNVKNYADTLTTLLALLSHSTGSDGLQQVAKSVIIILDEFDLFTTHSRQTLLYNLFDIAQSRKAPIAVLGLTTRFDVAEALEKRVKSRFSHRQVYLPLAKQFSTYKDMCRSSLSLPLPKSRSDQGTTAWNDAVTSLFETSTALDHILHQHYNTTKSVPAFQTSLLLPVASLLTSAPLTPAQIRAHIDRQLRLAPSLQPPDNALTLIPSLSTLELSLLISAARLSIIHDTDTVSFALAYDEYKSLASKARIAASASGALAAGGARVWGGKVARAAWEGLVEKGLVGSAEGEKGREGVGRAEVSLEELGAVLEGGGVEGVSSGMVKWCKEL